SGPFDRVAPVVMSKNPRFNAGRGCRRDQIIAIRAECRSQLVQAVGRVTGGRVRHMVRNDKGWPIMRLSQLAGQPCPRELMLGQSILWKEGKGAAAPNEAMIVKLAFGYRRGLLAGAGDGVVRPGGAQDPQRARRPSNHQFTPIEHHHSRIRRCQQRGAILVKGTAIVFVVPRHEDHLAAEEGSGLFRIGKWRYVAGRMDAANVAGQDQEIYRTDERPQVRSETEGTGFAPGVRLIALPD